VLWHQFAWAFSIYREPDFYAERIASFDAQTVIPVLYARDDGWALICTYRGRHWANLRENWRLIERTTGLHEQYGDPPSTIPILPQLVQILEQEGRWISISTWQGPRWINLDFTPPTDALDALLRRHGDRVSVYFSNIETGFTYRYNANRVYHGASVPKAPFSMYIYQKADRGETNLDSRHRFQGGFLSQREMLRRNLMYSCNTSTLTLRDVHGTAGYRRWVADLGGNSTWVSNSIMGSRLTIEEAARFTWAIYHYIESDAPHSAEFRQHLLNNRFRHIISDYPLASKSGWTSTVFHDIAIVYADSPYILVVLSQRANHAAFREISMAFQRFNGTWFVY